MLLGSSILQKIRYEEERAIIQEVYHEWIQAAEKTEDWDGIKWDANPWSRW